MPTVEKNKIMSFVGSTKAYAGVTKPYAEYNKSYT